MQPYLTILFPAYNEEKRISTAIISAANYFSTWKKTIEIMIVENGTTDNTSQIATAAALDYLPNNMLYTYLESRKGKGAAIREGLNKAKGKYILITDVDLSTPLNELPKLLRYIVEFPIVIGSRRKKGALVLGQSVRRQISSFIFSILARLLTPGILDTQCGYKLLTLEAARDLAEFITIDGYTYDVELLHAAQQRGYKIKEIPVIWVNDENSKVNLLEDSLNMARDLLYIQARSAAGKYK